MYLKSLELQGFKSFPDKVKLEFNQGLTAVVGPNGSGKSNIGDAVRWVLGEQSSKTLRGAKMEDVIFAGTQQRKALGFAQVTLCIGNIRGAVRSSLVDSQANELSITRKLYRSGESEYLVNGGQARLRDITELFMDTGLGRDGYSIIGQGRVAEIVSAKSGERRQIFEEAAGISKLRYEKEGAVRNLEKAEANLTIARMRVSDMESRVEPLRIQSEKAAQFISLSEEKKTLELSVWMRQTENQQKILQTVEEKILINHAEYEHLETDLFRLQEASEDNHRAMQRCTATVNELQAEILAAEQENGQLTAGIAVCENEISHCLETIAALEKQQEEAKTAAANADFLLADKQKEMEALTLRQQEKENDVRTTEEELIRISAESGGFDRSTEEWNTILNNLYAKQSEYHASATTARMNRREMGEQLIQQEEQYNRLSATLRNLDGEAAEIQDGLADLDQRGQNLQNKIQGLSRLQETRLQKLKASQDTWQGVRRQLDDRQHRHKALSDLEQSMMGFDGAVKAVLQAGRQGRFAGVHGSVAQLIRVESRYTVAIETAVGRSGLQNIVVENENTAKRCIQFLKEERAGRATFLPLTSVKGRLLEERGLEECDGFIALACDLTEFSPQYTGVIRSLLGRTVIAEDLDAASLIARRYGYRFRIVTLDGQVINAGGSFTGGSIQQKVGILSRRSELESLEGEIRRLTGQLAEQKNETDRLQADTDKIAFDIAAEKDTLTRLNEDRIQFQAEARRIISLREQGDDQLSHLKTQQNRLRQRMEELASTLKTAESGYQACSAEIAQVQRQLTDMQGKQDQFRQQREELAQTLSNLRIQAAELAKDREALAETIQRLTGNAATLAEQEEQILWQIDGQQKKKKENEERILQCRQSLEQSGSHTADLRQEILRQQAAHQEHEQKNTQLRRQEQTLTEEKEKFSREDIRLQEQKNNVQRELDAIASELWEQYEMTRSEAARQALKLTEQELPEARRKLSDVKNKIRTLGSVNVGAVEEYKEVFAEFTRLSEQLKDAETSKREVEQLLEDLTAQMRQRFQTSFGAINENFQQIFVELFGGGKAELILTDPEDVLSSGIEINVAPPGKVIKNLSLLSGGEQSFVAIAIYFAILKLRPSPFCILDEIEAALDDVNVSRYAQYLRNFTDTTQFILITHRRGSMDEADVLYGVTMQEKGISKLLKMEQTDVASLQVIN